MSRCRALNTTKEGRCSLNAKINGFCTHHAKMMLSGDDVEEIKE